MVIGAHWIDHLDNEGRIAKCKPHDFKFEDEWLPLYTRAGVTKQVSGLSSLLNTQGDSPLIAIIPPDMLFQYEREYVIHQLPKADCLAWVSIYYGKNQWKQIAFCPYCGVMNENSVTTYSHARKHLGITFFCGGCYGKLYKAPQHLSHHMKSCRPCLMNRPEGSQRSVRKKCKASTPASCPREWTAALASEALLVQRPLVSSCYGDPWSLFYHLRPSVSVLCYSISGGCASIHLSGLFTM